jgi:penicillin amidase
VGGGGVVRAAAAAALRGWDFKMEPESVAASVYSAARLHLQRRVFMALLGPEALAGPDPDTLWVWGASAHFRQLETRLLEHAAAGDAGWLPDGEDWPTALRRALADGVAWLEAHHGPDPARWAWGRLHRVTAAHPLAELHPGAAGLLRPPPRAIGGDGDTVQCGAWSQGVALASGRFDASACSVARWCFDLGDWANSRWVVPLGAAADPRSPHAEDQAALWQG